MSIIGNQCSVLLLISMCDTGVTIVLDTHEDNNIICGILALGRDIPYLTCFVKTVVVLWSTIPKVSILMKRTGDMVWTSKKTNSLM
jgi:hypothetical protein